MTKLLHEIKNDASFIKSHTLQPQWFKVFKIFILLSLLTGYFFLFSLIKTVVFLAVFLFLMLVVHIVYRIKTDKFRKSWLDFIVVETEAGTRPKSIGKFYYSAVVLNLLLSILISQLIPR